MGALLCLWVGGEGWEWQLSLVQELGSWYLRILVYQPVMTLSLVYLCQFLLLATLYTFLCKNDFSVFAHFPKCQLCALLCGSAAE